MILNKNDFKVFNIFLFFWLTIGWLAFVLTLAGIFYWWILVLFVALIVALGSRFFFEPLFKISKTFITINLSIFIVVTFFSIFASPTIFSGRDQGSISEAAVRLSQNNKLKFSNSVSEDFFAINSIHQKKMSACLIEQNTASETNLPTRKVKEFYCHSLSSGKALNFPGFFYTPSGKLVTQFPLVYISWLSFFYSFFGLAGFIIANAILFYIFLLSIFLLSYKLTKPARRHKNNSFCVSTITLLMIATSFSFSWFLKFTLTENMALALLWTGVLQLASLADSKLTSISKNRQSLLILFMSMGLLIFTRIEGIAFFLMMLTVLLLYKNTAPYFRKNFFKIILPALVIVFAFSIWNFITDIYFYKAVLKSFIGDLSENSASLNSTASTGNLFKIFTLYGLTAPLTLGLFSAIYFLKKRNYQKLIPLFIVLPSFIYIFSPQITPDHPWMLRRFVFAILPVSILYASILLSDISQNKKNYRKAIYYKIILVVAILLNLPALAYFFSYIPSKNLINETMEISQKFTKNDLILVDQTVSGDGQQMIGSPMNFLFERNAVYFFNPDDLRGIAKDNYDKIYLIAPQEKVEYYKKSSLGSKMTPFDKYSIKTNRLVKKPGVVSFPEKKSITLTGEIFEIKK